MAPYPPAKAIIMMKEYELKKEIKRLASIRGNGTELISIYVPPGFPISEETSKLREEHGQALGRE